MAETLNVQESAFVMLSSNVGKWTKDLSNVPKLKRKWLNVQREDIDSDKSYKYFIEGFVHHVLVFIIGDNAATKAKCKTSQKSNGCHNLCIIFKHDGIKDAYCGCAAGLSGSCHHVGALFLFVYHWQMKGFTEIPGTKTCPNQLCTWITPSQSANATSPRIENVIISRHKKGVSLKQKMIRHTCSRYDPRALCDRKVDEKRRIELFKSYSIAVPSSPFVTHFKHSSNQSESP